MNFSCLIYNELGVVGFSLRGIIRCEGVHNEDKLCASAVSLLGLEVGEGQVVVICVTAPGSSFLLMPLRPVRQTGNNGVLEFALEHRQDHSRFLKAAIVLYQVKDVNKVLSILHLACYHIYFKRCNLWHQSPRKTRYLGRISSDHFLVNQWQGLCLPHYQS